MYVFACLEVPWYIGTIVVQSQTRHLVFRGGLHPLQPPVYATVWNSIVDDAGLAESFSSMRCMRAERSSTSTFDITSRMPISCRCQGAIDKPSEHCRSIATRPEQNKWHFTDAD